MISKTNSAVEKTGSRLEALRAKRAAAEARLNRAIAARASDSLDLTVDSPETDKILDKLWREAQDAEREIFGLDGKIESATKDLAKATAAAEKAEAEENLRALEKYHSQRIRAAKEVSRALAAASEALRELELAGIESRKLIPERLARTHFNSVPHGSLCAFENGTIEAFSHEYFGLNLPLPLRLESQLKPNSLSFVDQVVQHGDWILESYRKAIP